jgi:hypothetical protein
MRLFAFTRAEGSDERNPWAVLLRRRRAWVREAIRMVLGVGFVILFAHERWKTPGLFSPALLTAFAVGVVGGLTTISAIWQRILRSPLLPVTDVTPQRAHELMAAIEWRAQRWMIFIGILLGATLSNAHLHLARIVAPEWPLLALVHFALFVTAGLAAWAFIWALMGFAANITFFSQTKSVLGRSLGYGCLGILVIFFAGPVFVMIIGVVWQEIGRSASLALPFLGRMPPMDRVSGYAMLAVPSLLAATLAVAAMAFGLCGRALWRGHSDAGLDALREAVANERARKTKWLF